MKLFPSEEKHSTGREPNGMWSDVPSAKSKRRAGSSLRRIAKSFENLKVLGENEARKPMPIGSSRVQSQSSFSRRFLEERIEKCCYRLCLAENFLERGRWQTNSWTFFVLKTNRLVLGGIRNTNSSDIFTWKLVVKNAIVSEL